MSVEDDVRAIFKRNKLVEDKIREIVKYIESGDEIEIAWPNRTRVEVEQVEAYGLVLGVDANGEACRVEFPWGAGVTVDG